jgi:hypothetical protein
MIFSRFVYARASRMALIVASVPEFTILTISIDGMIEQMSSAMRTSNPVGAPKLVPFTAARCTASITRG